MKIEFLRDGNIYIKFSFKPQQLVLSSQKLKREGNAISSTGGENRTLKRQTGLLRSGNNGSYD